MNYDTSINQHYQLLLTTEGCYTFASRLNRLALALAMGLLDLWTSCFVIAQNQCHLQMQPDSWVHRLFTLHHTAWQQCHCLACTWPTNSTHLHLINLTAVSIAWCSVSVKHHYTDNQSALNQHSS